MVGNTGIDKLGKMREIVKEELKHIPGDNAAQKRLRQIYWISRMSSLGKNQQAICPKKTY